MAIDTSYAVSLLMETRNSKRSIAPFTSTDDDLSIETAWAIQDALSVELTRRGKAPIGWKLAATGPTGQALIGVTEPIYGYLLADAHLNDAAVSRSNFVELGIEAEIAFRMERKLTGPNVTAAIARDALDCMMPALELPDLIFSGTPKVADFIAASAVGKAIVLGLAHAPLDDDELMNEKVALHHNGQLVGTNCASEVMGNPLNALAWLANQLGARGKALMPGDIVMSGGISNLVRGQVGDVIQANFSKLGRVAMKVLA